MHKDTCSKEKVTKASTFTNQVHVLKVLTIPKVLKFTKMSSNRCFTLVGDSNIRRNINSINCRDRPLMKAAQVVVCKKMSLLSQALSEVRAISNVCVVSCISNFISDAEEEEEGSVSTPRSRSEPVITEFRSLLYDFSQSRPECKIMVTPPMYRMKPFWYRNGLSEILSLFSDLMSDGRPPNLQLLPSFSSPELESDGIHLTSYSGLQFVLHVFDHCVEILDRPSLEEEVISSKTAESSRLLLDKFVVLEQDHRRLDKDFEMKSAVDAEYHDFLENQHHEDHLLVSGLEPPSGELQGREWQDFVKRQLTVVFNAVIGRDCPILFIQNHTSRARGAETLYQVRLEKVEDSKAIRSKFGFFFRGGQDQRPPELSKVSVRNWVTHETRVRLAIMKVLGKRYQDNNPGSKMRIVSYESRPSLHLTPPPDSREKKIKRFNFIEAVSKLPTCFSSSEVSTIMKAVGGKFIGKLRSLFVVVNDDMRGVRSSASGDVESVPEIICERTSARSGKRGAEGAPASRSAKSFRT